MLREENTVPTEKTKLNSTDYKVSQTEPWLTVAHTETLSGEQSTEVDVCITSWRPLVYRHAIGPNRVRSTVDEILTGKFGAKAEPEADGEPAAVALWAPVRGWRGRKRENDFWPGSARDMARRWPCEREHGGIRVSARVGGKSWCALTLH